VEKTLDLKKNDGVHKVLLLNERNSRCTVRLKLCSSQAWGKETDTSSKQSGRERFNRGLGWTCHRVDFSWTVQVLVLLG